MIHAGIGDGNESRGQILIKLYGLMDLAKGQ